MNFDVLNPSMFAIQISWLELFTILCVIFRILHFIHVSTSELHVPQNNSMGQIACCTYACLHLKKQIWTCMRARNWEAGILDPVVLWQFSSLNWRRLVHCALAWFVIGRVAHSQGQQGQDGDQERRAVWAGEDARLPGQRVLQPPRRLYVLKSVHRLEIYRQHFEAPSRRRIWLCTTPCVHRVVCWFDVLGCVTSVSSAQNVGWANWYCAISTHTRSCDQALVWKI